MSTIIPKSQMTEDDIKLNFITPALIAACWQNKITMETKDDPNTITSHEVFFSLYQQLTDREDEKDKDDTVSRLTQLFNPDFFDLVIADECHKGSAKKDSNWRKILEYFNSAAQIGMTATPKETKYISNSYYFGDPIYTYSLRKVSTMASSHLSV